LAFAAIRPAPASATDCAHATDTWATASIDQLERSIGCLVNEKRHDRGKHRLDRNGKLDEAAAKHTRQMIKKDCLSHRCPGEPGLGGRIRDTGYLKGANRWRYAENTGCAATPKAMFNAWFDSSFYRENMLKSTYRDVGIGAAKGVPDVAACDHDQTRTTYTMVFAWREP
jgi:uncharacterized protein YkwD